VSKRKKEQISNKVVQNIFHCCKVLFINAVSVVMKTWFLLYQENTISNMSRPLVLFSCKCNCYHAYSPTQGCGVGVARSWRFL